MKHFLNRRYWRWNNESTTQVEKIEAEFTTLGLFITDTGESRIRINKNGQKRLYELLKARFEK